MLVLVRELARAYHPWILRILLENYSVAASSLLSSSCFSWVYFVYAMRSNWMKKSVSFMVGYDYQEDIRGGIPYQTFNFLPIFQIYRRYDSYDSNGRSTKVRSGNAYTQIHGNSLKDGEGVCHHLPLMTNR